MPLASRQIEIARVRGIAIVLDPSWFLILIFLTWGLAVGYFPARIPHLHPLLAWAAGLFASLGLFASVTLHELGHSLLAISRKLPVKRIVLFVFGGVSQLEGEPDNPRTEVTMAVAGPAVSFVLAGFFALARTLLVPEEVSPLLHAYLSYLATVNLALGIFNLLPGFPLDGGRVLRSLLWFRWKNSLRATRVASEVGSGMGLALIVLGLFSVLFGEPAGGLWFLLVGFFLRNAASASYQQAAVSTLAKGVTVRGIMTVHPVTVGPDIPLDQFVDRYILGHHHPAFPVEEGGILLGLADMERVKAVPRADWGRKKVREVLRPLWDVPTAHPEDDVSVILQKMSSEDLGRILVVEGGRLAGIISRRDILDYLTLKAGLPAA